MNNWILNDYRGGHDHVQVERFILAKEGVTLFGAYRQCLREIVSRLVGVFKKPDSTKAMAVPLIHHQLAESTDELKAFVSHAIAMKADLGEITPEKRYRFEREFWHTKIKAMGAVDYIVDGRLGRDTIGLASALHKEDRARVMKELSSRRRLLRWWSEYELLIPRLNRLPADSEVQQLAHDVYGAAANGHNLLSA